MADWAYAVCTLGCVGSIAERRESAFSFSAFPPPPPFSRLLEAENGEGKCRGGGGTSFLIPRVWLSLRATLGFCYCCLL